MDIPVRIGRYPVTAVLGQGNMGIVYRGRDESLDRDVALKVMAATSGDADGRARFRREALAAARLQHPNIVTIYELGEHEGRPFIAMELLEGMDLRDAIEAGLRPNPSTTLPIVLQVLAGLGHAHEQGVVHRDVKPSNVFLPQHRPAKLMDFGVARVSGGGTTAGAIVGTPNYMSPEQVQGRAVDGRSDLFSTGLILYELVTGERAFGGDTVVSVLYKIANESPDLSLLPRDPRWATLRSVLERSLAQSPDERYPTAEAMANDVARALTELGGGPSWTTAASPQIRVRAPATHRPSPDAVRPPTTFGEVAHFRPTARHVLLGLSLGAVVLVAGVLAGLAWITGTRPRAPIPAAPTPAGTIQTAGETTPTPATPPATPVGTPSPEIGSTPTPATPPPTARVRPTMAPAPLPTPATARSTSRPQGDIDRANDLLEQRRYRSALNEARAILERNPNNREAQIIAEDAEAALVVEERLDSARDAVRRGDQAAALEEVRKGLAVAPNDARLLKLFRELTQ